MSSFSFRCFFFLMIRRPPRSTPLYSSAASDVYKRQLFTNSRHGLQRHQPFGLVCAYGLDQGIYVNPFLRESHPFQPLDQSLGALRHGLRAFRKAGVVHAEGDDLTFLTAKEGHHGFPALGLQTYAVDDGGLVCQRISLLQHRWVGAIQGEWQIHGVLDHLHQPRHVLHLVPYPSRGVHIYIRRTGRFLSLDVLPDVLGVAVRYCFLYRRPGGIDPFTDDYHDLNPSAVLMAAPASLAKASAPISSA